MSQGFVYRTRLIFYYKRLSAGPDFLMWRLKGSPLRRIPHLVKRAVVREYAERFQLPVLIETGTQYGQMINAVRKQFREVYTIELDDTNYSQAVKNFAGHKNVHVIHGDSAVELPRLLKSIADPCLFWLDGHSGKTPIMDELRAIFSHKPHQHVPLIDDAHCFGTSPYYPTLDAVKELTQQMNPGATVEVRDNIIRIHNENSVQQDRFRLGCDSGAIRPQRLAKEAFTADRSAVRTPHRVSEYGTASPESGVAAHLSPPV